MLCPICGKEMEEGFLIGTNYYTPSDLFWRGKGEQVSAFDKFMGAPGRQIHCENKKASQWTRRYEIEANYCPSCEKILFDGRVAKYL